jgi:hypothetical protein
MHVFNTVVTAICVIMLSTAVMVTNNRIDEQKQQISQLMTDLVSLKVKLSSTEQALRETGIAAGLSPHANLGNRVDLLEKAVTEDERALRDLKLAVRIATQGLSAAPKEAP